MIYNLFSHHLKSSKHLIKQAIMLSKTTLLSLLLAGAFASPMAEPDLEERQSCPQIYIFGARETTAPAGYGTAGSVVQSIQNAHPGAGAEAINYPASGSNPSYSQSVLAGTNAVCNQVGSLARRCPSTKIVLVGYSQVSLPLSLSQIGARRLSSDVQGAEIFDNALCGGGDPNQGIYETCSIASYNVVAAIFMGDPRFRAGAPYNVGSCAAGGVSAWPPESNDFCVKT